MKLSHLTDKTLLGEMLHLVQRERSLLAQVLWHLKEIDQRKLYSDLKCGSLFQYCVKVLKYSEGQAARRVSACRLLKDLPELTENIQSGELNLTQLNQAKGFFQEMGVVSPVEKRKIIDEIKGKTIQETETILSEKREEKPSSKVTITLNRETVEALKKVQALKAHSCPDLDSLIVKMTEEVSKSWDPEIIYRRRKVGEGKTRYVQAGVRAHVWRRDQNKCTQCGSKFALQIDHIKPFALGGKTLPENLRLLCRNCNQRKGLKDFPSGGKGVLTK